LKPSFFNGIAEQFPWWKKKLYTHCKNKRGLVNLSKGFDDNKVLKEQLVLRMYVQVCKTKDSMHRRN
jgi:hypothetical protein